MGLGREGAQGRAAVGLPTHGVPCATFDREYPLALNVPLLRGSFELVVERNPNLTDRFYEILFDRYPQAKPLFGRNSERAQSQMLTEALVAVVDHLEDAPWLVANLGALGKRHEGYGVTPEMYGWVGASLLATLAEVGANEWTPEVNAAWTEAYGAIVNLCLSGTGEA